jgi:lipopolysaccharide heptosyltransferase II
VKQTTSVQAGHEHALGPALVETADVKRILVMAYGHIADTLPAFAALRALRDARPDAHIAVLALEYVREMFERCADVDEVLVMRDFKYKNTRRGKLESLLRLAQLLPRLYRRYDMVLVLHARTRFLTRLAWLSGARIRAGFSDVAAPRMITHPARPLSHFASFREENRRVLEAVGVTGMGAGLEFALSERDVDGVRQLLALEGAADGVLLVGLHPGSHWTCQQWDVAEWSALADDLVTRFGARIVISGGPGEGDLARAIIERMRAPSAGVINLAGKTSIMQFAALIRILSCLVCVNSAASQVALAVHTPVVNLVGYENPVWTAPIPGEPMAIVRGCDDTTALASWCPYNVWGKLSECHRPECVGIGGMSLIRRDRVTREVEKWLRSDRAPALRDSMR